MQQSKYSSPYSLVKEPLQKTTVYSIFNAKNKQTNQIWLAKVFHSLVLQQLSLEEHVAYNQQVLRNISEKQKRNVVFVSEIFIKGNDTFFIQEKYETKLSDYISSQGTLRPKQIQRILKDAFQGICDIYEESYIHCNLRSEHLVKVTGQNYQNKEDYVWKIDWLVLDSNEFPIHTPFTWKRECASPQDKKKDSELPQQMLDAQIIWNFGYLAMEMLIGQKSLNEMMHKQNDIEWARIKQLTKSNPGLYELINGCFRFNFKERIPLSRFLDLKLFHDVARPGIQDYFMTCSKIFRTSTLSSFQKSFTLKSKSKIMNGNMKSKIIKPSAPITYFNNLQEVKEEVYDQQNQKNITLYCLLVQVSNYLNLIHSPIENPSKMLDNRMIIEIFILKYANLVESKIKQNTWSLLLQNIQAQHKSKIKNQSKQVKRIRQKENTLVLKFNLDLKKEYNEKELITICNKLCGYAYSRLREDCQHNEEPIKLKAMIYFSLIPYLINVQDWSLAQEKKKENMKDLVELFKKGDLNMLLKLSQTIIKQYFQIDT